MLDPVDVGEGGRDQIAVHFLGQLKRGWADRHFPPKGARGKAPVHLPGLYPVVPVIAIVRKKDARSGKRSTRLRETTAWQALNVQRRVAAP